MDAAAPVPTADGVHPAALHAAVLPWYDAHARDLPWRRPGVSAWQVLVSEIMLQQTPVGRVLPVYAAWVDRWPGAADLAAEPAGEAVRAWGRLGYPRRALRLHACARAITDGYGGRVPSDASELRALPGVGDYTAAAVAAFAYRRSLAVLDTNVRRVLARVVTGRELAPPSVSVAERRLAEALLPVDPDAPRWSVAVMELGALVCTARSPTCGRCPVATQCRWRAAGYPPEAGPPRRVQAYAGTDRQCRGRLLGVLRDAPGPVQRHLLEAAWADEVQRERALTGLVADGLAVPAGAGRYGLAT